MAGGGRGESGGFPGGEPIRGRIRCGASTRRRGAGSGEDVEATRISRGGWTEAGASGEFAGGAGRIRQRLSSDPATDRRYGHAEAAARAARAR